MIVTVAADTIVNYFIILIVLVVLGAVLHDIRAATNDHFHNQLICD